MFVDLQEIFENDFPDGFCCTDCPMIDICDFQNCSYLDDF